MQNTLGNFCITIGSQWGDEGKGKLVDILAQEYDIIARAAGGANAGHTLYVDGKKYVLHLIPSGILHGKPCVIGSGCVVHIPALIEEMEMLLSQGVEVRDNLLISDRAQILFDFHKLVDAMLEERKGDKKIGSTKRGIGPAYTSKVARLGVRMGDLVDNFDYFEDRFRSLVKDIELSYGIEIDAEAELIVYKSFADQFADIIIDTSKYLCDAMEEGATVLAEGAQGAMLDVDHGTYPFVTSSNTCTGGTCAGLGVAPTKIDSVLAITKAYTTRVGSGPFPTELEGKDGEILRQAGGEFGATTGRPRRCGWLDIIALRAAQRVNGFTHINLTKLDVLSGMKELKIAVKYTLYGEEIFNIPLTSEDWDNVEVEYQIFPGWDEDISHCRNFSELPQNAQNYVKAIEDMLGVPVSFIGTGMGREDLILR